MRLLRTSDAAPTRPAARALRILAGALVAAALGACEQGAETPAVRQAAGVDTASVIVRPAGVEDVLAAVNSAGAKVTVVNVWATWCLPCREEFPDIMRLHQSYADRGMRLLLVSVDFEDQLPQVRRFLAGHGVDFPTYLKTGNDMQFIDRLNPEWTGAIPATFVYDANGLRFFHEGKVTFAELETEVRSVIDSTRSHTESEVHS